APLDGGRGGVVTGGHSGHLSRLLSMVLVAVSQASSGDLPLATRITPLSPRPWPMIRSFGPMIWTGICLAAAAKISPIGASPVMSFFAPVTALSSYAACALGKLPCTSNSLTCCSGAVSQATSFFASSTFLPLLGTVRNEPPQLPDLGGTATSHLPAASGCDLPLI